MSEAQYRRMCNGQRRYDPSCADKLLSLHSLKKSMENRSGVMGIEHDMCVTSCLGFTGPYAKDKECRICHERRYDIIDGKEVPRKRFTTIPVSPGVQANYQTAEGARRMKSGMQRLRETLDKRRPGSNPSERTYVDITDGEEMQKAMQDGKIKDGDFMLMLSIDGAQLYRNKESDCWIYIWVLFDLPPNRRYKKRHILPGAIIPGPNKPKDIDSFLFPGLYHIAALQNSEHGLAIWDAETNTVIHGKPFFVLASADGPAMAWISGCVGCQGKNHCRYYCPIHGRRKPGQSTYYPCRFKPRNYNVPGSDHGDVDLTQLLNDFMKEQMSGAIQTRYQDNLIRVLASVNQARYEFNRLETGICKQSIFSGLNKAHMLEVPSCFAGDIMHLPALNIPELFIPLWTKKIDCNKDDNKDLWLWATLVGEVWKSFGKDVEDAKPYIPGSFDRPPRNPAKKINSGYKAWEFLLLFYGLGPCLLWKRLEHAYWANYCKLVKGIQILLQEEITFAEVMEAHKLLTQFSDEFEKLYVDRHPGRIHFVRPCIHGLAHLVLETLRLGPGAIYSQWAMERTIGNLGQEIKNDKDPFANLTTRALERCQVNALAGMIPDLDIPGRKEPNSVSSTARPVGGGYFLLRAKDRSHKKIPEAEAVALKAYLMNLRQTSGTPKNLYDGLGCNFQMAKL